MYFLLKSYFTVIMDSLSLVCACLALLGALYKRNDVAFTVGGKSIKAFVPFFMATSIWSIHYIVLCRAMGQPYDAVGLVYPLGSYGLMVLGFYCALKMIDLGFPFSNYLSGAVIGGFLALGHVMDKYALAHSGAQVVARAGLSPDSMVLALSFVLLWSAIVGYLTDYFKNHEMITHLKTIAYTDTLTSLQNRNALNEHFANRLENSGQTFACMMIDLNKFKDINDTYGHLVGDEMLAVIGRRLKERFKDKEYFVGRLGGDEFIVLAGYQSRVEIDALAEVIYRLVVAPHGVGDVPLKVGCCIGISLFPTDGTTQKALMGHADISLYEMKKNNCDGVCFYNGGHVRTVFAPAVPAVI